MGRGPLTARARRIRAFVCSVGILVGYALAGEGGEDQDGAWLSAGPYTTQEAGPAAFSVPVDRLDRDQRAMFDLGKEKFNEAWVVAPASGGVWGLGPTFNEDRCAHCHVGNGRAAATADGHEAERGVVVRLSIPGTSPEGAALPDARYGDQLQNRGIEGRVPAEGLAVIRYTSRRMDFPDGESIDLRVPHVEFRDLQFGPIDGSTMTSVRIAPALIGLGLLEAVPEERILEQAARQASLGLRGKPNFGWDYENGKRALGRFGWKASQPSLRQQVAAAFLADIGATTYLFPEENCPAVQKQCRDVPSAAKCGGQGGCTGNDYRPEVQPSRLNGITVYMQSLAVPARRAPEDPTVKRGEAVFSELGCAACHLPELKTASRPAFGPAANVTFHAYTDLLLHDMGDDLADGRPDFQADGRQWRTAPLWGVGLLPRVSGHSDLLHDGRARNPTEAILWHGGEAQAAREGFRHRSPEDRRAVVAFVNSL
jgi:CxxC motif-containing protein (DUF1111 family)